MLFKNIEFVIEITRFTKDYYFLISRAKEKVKKNTEILYRVYQKNSITKQLNICSLFDKI